LLHGIAVIQLKQLAAVELVKAVDRLVPDWAGLWVKSNSNPRPLPILCHYQPLGLGTRKDLTKIWAECWVESGVEGKH